MSSSSYWGSYPRPHRCDVTEALRDLEAFECKKSLDKFLAQGSRDHIAAYNQFNHEIEGRLRQKIVDSVTNYYRLLTRLFLKPENIEYPDRSSSIERKDKSDWANGVLYCLPYISASNPASSQLRPETIPIDWRRGRIPNLQAEQRSHAQGRMIEREVASREHPLEHVIALANGQHRWVLDTYQGLVQADLNNGLSWRSIARHFDECTGQLSEQYFLLTPWRNGPLYFWHPDIPPYYRRHAEASSRPRNDQWHQLVRLYSEYGWPDRFDKRRIEAFKHDLQSLCLSWEPDL